MAGLWSMICIAIIAVVHGDENTGKLSFVYVDC